jgi:hypothetical protein
LEKVLTIPVTPAMLMRAVRTTMRAETQLLADAFWARVGDPGPYPRDMERAAALALPVVLVKLPRLTIEALTDWLKRRGVLMTAPLCEGEMAGCIVGHRGHAVIFLTATDPEDERRATLAHEIAHVLLHYLTPRARVLRALGPSILEVLDGDRQASFAERARGALQGVQLGVHVHVLPREGRRSIIPQVEREADELALQLTAPREAVLEYVHAAAHAAAPPRECRAGLARRFGLPEGWFAAYAPEHPVHPRDRLDGILAQLRRTE